MSELKSRPFNKLRHPDTKEELLSRILYHQHRAIELLHRFEKEYHKPIYEKKYTVNSPGVVVSPHN